MLKKLVEQEKLQFRFVITSYSIHYTKLYEVSTAKPVTTISGIGTSFTYVKDAVNLSGTASDNNGISSVEVNYSLNGGASTALLVTGTTSWSASLPLTEGLYDVTIKLTDGTLEETTYSRSVAIDTTSPDLEITAPIATTIAESSSFTIRGTATDNGGKGVTELSYSRDNVTWVPITISGLSWNKIVDFSPVVGTETTQGARKLYVKASDGLNPERNNFV